MLLILTAVVFFSGGCFLFYRSRRLARIGLRAMAEVVDLKAYRSSGGDDDGVVYAPVVVFRAADGREVRAETGRRSYPPPARVGERVEVIYDPDSPQGLGLELSRGHGRGLALYVALMIVGIGAAVYEISQLTR
ncbi:MAG: DUF3592 domain-containing protein [Trebonia sp.]